MDLWALVAANRGRELKGKDLVGAGHASRALLRSGTTGQGRSARLSLGEVHGAATGS